VVWAIIGLIVLAILIGIFYGKYYSTNEKGSENAGEIINFDNSVDIGDEVSKSTDANSFDDVKLNPFEENE